jgi:hypothetical protein
VGKNSKGFTLASLAVGIALVSILAYLASSYLGHSFRMGKAQSSRMDAVDLRRFILSNFSCANTTKNSLPQCNNPSNPSVDAKNNQNENLIEQTNGSHYTQLSNYYLRARCLSLAPGSANLCTSGKFIAIEYAPKFPITTNSNNAVTWTDLFAGVPLCCVESF